MTAMVGRRATPGTSLQTRWQEQRADYDAAKASKFRRVRSGLAAGGSHADYHVRSEGDWLRLLEYARDLDRNDPVVGRMLDLSATMTVQDGIAVKSSTGNSDFDDALDAKWLEWSEDPQQCDRQGEMNFGQLQRLAFRQMQGDGDAWALLDDDGMLQHFEAHRVRTPKSTQRNVVHGVLLDEKRRRREVWITREDLDPNTPLKTVGQVQAYPVYDEAGARRIVQLRSQKRISQTRGVTVLAPIFDLSGMAQDIHFATLVQKQIVSCWGLFIKRTADYAGGAEPQIGALETQQRNDGSTETIENMSPGMLWRGRVGEEPVTISSHVPNAEYFQFIEMTHKMMMAALGLPYMLVMLDASQTNFSGWRGAYDTAKMGWRQNQRDLISQYVRPIWRWKVAQWIEDDPVVARLAARRSVQNVYGAQFHRPTYPYIQPTQDALTDILMLANMLTSPQRHFAAKGDDAYDIAAETITFRKDQITAAARAAQEINSAAGLDGSAAVTWRDLLPVPSSQGMTINLNATPESAGKPPGGGANG